MRDDSNTPASSSKTTTIASGSKITGEIAGSAELRVDGEIEGTVKLEGAVTIGPTGRVKGQIEARTVQIHGKVVGNVHGRDTVSIHSDGSLEGDVVSPRMSIADGAFFKGKVEMAGGGQPALQGSGGAREARS